MTKFMIKKRADAIDVNLINWIRLAGSLCSSLLARETQRWARIQAKGTPHQKTKNKNKTKQNSALFSRIRLGICSALLSFDVRCSPFPVGICPLRTGGIECSLVPWACLLKVGGAGKGWSRVHLTLWKPGCVCIFKSCKMKMAEKLSVLSRLGYAFDSLTFRRFV